jgi:hypothetical protein
MCAWMCPIRVSHMCVCHVCFFSLCMRGRGAAHTYDRSTSRWWAICTVYAVTIRIHDCVTTSCCDPTAVLPPSGREEDVGSYAPIHAQAMYAQTMYAHPALYCLPPPVLHGPFSALCSHTGPMPSGVR